MRRIIFISMAVFLLAACKQKQAIQQEKAGVKVAMAERVTESLSRRYTFISEPYRVTQLAFRVGGPVKDFTVQNGQFFRKGQLIAAIDNRDFAVSEERAGAICKQTESEYRRISNLYDKDNVSGSVYEKARADYAKARADYDNAKNSYTDTRLVAPFDGYVQQTHIERYQNVQPSQPVVTFIDLSSIKVETFLPEDMAVALRNNDSSASCRIMFDNMPNKDFKPYKTYLTQAAGENNLSFKFTALIDNKDNKLLGGMSGNMEISVHSQTQSGSAVCVPQTAVCNENEECFVWLINNEGRVIKRPVIQGRLLSDGRIEIVSGLTAGDKVVVTRQSYLSEGDIVSVIGNKKKGKGIE